MLYKDICRTLSYYIWILILPLCIPFGISFYCEVIAGPEIYPQPPSTLAFAFTIFIASILGGVFYFIGRESSGELYRREGLLLVILVYFITPIIGALPFFLSGTLANPVDAYFESVSGLTTTGATVMEAKQFDPKTDTNLPTFKTFVTGLSTTYAYYGTIDPVIDPETGTELYSGLEAVSPALIFWRSLMQWLGGGGIIVLFVAVLPALGVGGKILYQMEVTGLSKESLLPRIKETASLLWKIYLLLTLVEILLLVATNRQMSLFNATTISLSTISTGGFVPNNGGIAAFHNGYTELIIIIFMILGSISFPLYFYCAKGKFNRLNDPELKTFFLIILFSVLIALWQLIGKPMDLLSSPNQEEIFSFWTALRYGAFQVISFQTSTGFTTADYDFWPFSVQTLMLILMFIGGMAGSTAGGLKVIRYRAFFRIMLNKIEAIYRPDTVRVYRLGNRTLNNWVATTILCFFLIAGSLTIIGTFIFVLEGIDPETSLTSISCMVNNTGLSFRGTGPTESFAFLPNISKLIGTFLMIAGRLEYFAILIAFVPAFWKTNY